MNSTLSKVKESREIDRSGYRWRLSRISALVIFQECMYISDMHFECFMDILESNFYSRESNFSGSDEELISMLGDKAKVAELTKLNGGIGILVYKEEDIDCFTKYYPDYPVYVLTK